MTLSRRCSRSACGRPAIATLTYDYAGQIAVLGPLALYAEPHSYDLCAEHSQRLSAPRGWEVLRLASDPADAEPTTDDLLALADAVREAGRPAVARAAQSVATVSALAVPPQAESASREVGRRGHLRVLAPVEE